MKKGIFLKNPLSLMPCDRRAAGSQEGRDFIESIDKMNELESKRVGSIVSPKKLLRNERKNAPRMHQTLIYLTKPSFFW